MIQCKFIMLHTSATPEGKRLSGDDIIRMHTGPVKDGGRGWKNPGYGEYHRLEGTVEYLQGNDGDEFVDPWEITNGARGLNSLTYHMCYEGGCAATKEKWMRFYPPKDTRTKEQLESLKERVFVLLERYPKAKLIGHNQVANKACPSFDVPTWALSIGVPKNRIYFGK
jgi:hypothetical protein